jgi:hypothetical protein
VASTPEGTGQEQFRLHLASGRVQPERRGGHSAARCTLEQDKGSGRQERSDAGSLKYGSKMQHELVLFCIFFVMICILCLTNSVII